MRPLLLTLVLAVTTWCTAFSKSTSDNWRLPTNVYPIHYSVSIQTFLPGYGWEADGRNGTFNGSVMIDLDVREPTDQIILHADSLTIEYQRIYTKEGNVGINRIELIPELQFLVVHLNTTIQPHMKTSLYLKFHGKLRNDNKGYYLTLSPNPEQGEPDRLNAVTQFETTSARFMIPCFDEPSFKATWKVTLISPIGTTSLTNTIVELADPIVNNGFVTTHFKKTVKMSSYTLAIFVGDVDYKETVTDRGVRIRVYAPPVYINKVNHSLKAAKRALEGFEKIFKINYPMEKLDFVAVKDFAFAAMENWGLIVHKNDEILGDNHAGVVYHEVAHQWFGNLVTMDFWHNMWLNEAFATYMVAKLMSHEDSTLDRDFYHTKNAQNIGLMHDTKAAVRELERSSDGNVAVNGMSYVKASSFIRMIETLMGTENFDMALRWYLSENKYKNVNEEDLYKTLEVFMPKDLLGPDGKQLNTEKFARCWMDQNGYPTVHVEETKNDTIRLTQQMDQRLDEGYRNKGICGYRWDIPIWYQQAGSDAVELVWFGKEQYSRELQVQSPVVINANSNGFYRVSYSNQLFLEIAKGLEQSNYSNSTKFRLLSDALLIPMEDSSKLHALVKLAEFFAKDSNEEVRKKAVFLMRKAKIMTDRTVRTIGNDKANIERILSQNPGKLLADCNSTTGFTECWFSISTNFDEVCINEGSQHGRSRDRLLEFLKSENNPGFRAILIQFIKCSDVRIFNEILNDEQYHLTEKEKSLIQKDLTQSLDPSNTPTRNFV